MMKRVFEPKTVLGEVRVPASKSVSHRAMICAALAGHSAVRGLSLSRDITATADALRALCGEMTLEGDGELGIFRTGEPLLPDENREPVEVDCAESASTLRFMIPLAASLGRRVRFTGRGRLPSRTTMPYKLLLEEHGARLDYPSEEGVFLPLGLSGRLSGGDYRLRGDISSQLVTGLLLALSVIGEGSVTLTSRLESRPYAELTVDMLSRFGIKIGESADGYRMLGGAFAPADIRVEGDCSQAAFFAVAAAINGEVTIHGLRRATKQGDLMLFEILEKCGAQVVWSGDDVTVTKGELHAVNIDASDIPDLVPALAVLAAFCEGDTEIYGAARLRLKESDRIASTAALIRSLGGEAAEGGDRLRIMGRGRLVGGEAASYGDHRIAMAAAAASVGCRRAVTVDDMSCIEKSYPAFLEDWDRLIK